MKINRIFGTAVLAVVALASFNSCDTDPEALTIQDLYKYDNQYFANLREWKKTPHAITYGYYASYSNAKNPTSFGERFLGLPDSIDIVNLWTEIPTPEDWPIAYQDMVYCQKMKGTRFVMHADAAHYNHTMWARNYNETTGEFEYIYDSIPDPNDATKKIPVYEKKLNEETGEMETVLDEKGNPKPQHTAVKTQSGNRETIIQYARWAVDTLVRCGLDGVDFDYEGWGGQDITWLAEECDKYLGPNGKWSEKLFIIDWFNGAPPAGTEPYTDWYIRQAYTWQIGFQTGSGGRPKEKTVLCESTGAESANGGKDGARIKDYAVWVANNNGGGCGAYYMDYNYMSTSGIPYKEFRDAVQIMNPAVAK